ncbi:tetratricopeptide repeat protein [Listeria aquatica]|uniref:TPR domain-containing protein n=1 Tax=Listeria aquatica FSL S10-1188 TaxID=1265818 RepID=W7B157_9LIST|nr:tetratricopeptide repeat protein [Listeria aquatica]EUJ19622.1 TPR domain-containing protein [Listeria aquatica FSL S10-1188]
MKNAEKMLSALEHENMDEAKKYFDAVVAGDSPEEQFFLAEQLFSLGFLDETEDLYELLLAAFPNEGELYVRLAEVSIEKDQLDEAAERLEQIKPDDDAYLESLLVAADLYQMQGLFEVTEQKLQQAKSLAPGEPIIDFALGEFYLSQARFASAVQSYQSVLDAGITALQDETISVYVRMAEALSASGAFEEAIPFYEKALEENESLDTLFGLGLTAFQAKEYATAIHSFEHLKEHDPSYTTLYPYLAKSYEENGQKEQALEILEEGLKQDEFNKELFFEAGQLALSLGRLEEAENFFRQALVLDPEYIDAMLELNKLLLDKADYDGLVEIFEGLSEELITEPQIFWDLSVAYQETEQYNKAKENFEKAYPHFKNNPTFLREYGLFLREEGDALATTILSDYLTFEPEDEEIRSLLDF